jgi:trehalose 6-phosphate phosphatase
MQEGRILMAESDSTVRVATSNGEHTASEALVQGVPDLRRRIETAAHVYLLLDYDGTLAPFHADRMAAVPLPGTMDAVKRIASTKRVSVALVSGRPVSELLALIGETGLTLVGSHGYEVRRSDGEEHTLEILPEQASVLDAAYADARQMFQPDRVERKAASVAAHFRGLNPRDIGDVEREIERRWRAAGAGELMEFRPFNGGLELRAAGRTKGTAILELLAAAPQGTLPIYVGDDDTDEDAFGALPETGIGIKVGPPEAVTKARGRVEDCESVRRLLIEMSHWASTRMGACR